MPALESQKTLGFAAVVFATLGTAAIALTALFTTVEQKDEAARSEAEGLQHVTELRLRAEQIVNAGRGYLLTGDQMYLTRFKASNEGFAATLKEISAQPGTLKNADLVEVRHAWGRYVLAAERATRRGEEGPDDAVAPYFERVMSPARDALEEQLVVLERDEREELAVAITHTHGAANRTALMLVFTTLISVSTSVWLSLTTQKRKQGPEEASEPRSTEIGI